MNIIVDGKEFDSQAQALAYFDEVSRCTKGVNKEQADFAYQKIAEGCDCICTYSGYAIKR